MSTVPKIAAIFGVAWLLMAGSTTAAEPRESAAAVAFFEKKVRPVLVSHCYNCHSADTKPAGDLRVDDRNGLLNGGKSGPAIVPGQPAKSLLLQRVTHKDAKKKMPQEGKELTEEEVADLTTWIKDGAAWPTLREPATAAKTPKKYERLRKEHWAWQPLADPKAPAVKDAAWPRDDMDRFLLAALEKTALRPVADADKGTLIRRVTFDLTGLPPTLADIDAFLKDESPKAFETVVDRLLDSPRFGERWGRHWLDVARYGESTGPSRNIPYPHAYRYRDYVIDAVNADVPYDRFLQEQLAGDLLPAKSDAERDRLLTATGFLALGVKDVNQRFKVRFVMDNVDEQIDAVSRAVLVLTVSCARCHDHKFDPIPTSDYYALAGIFTSTENRAGVRNKMGGGGLDYYDPAALVRLSVENPKLPAEQLAMLKDQVAQAKADWQKVRGTPEGTATGTNGQPKQRVLKQKYDRLQGDLDSITDPVARLVPVHGVRDAAKVGDTEVRLRGEAEALGAVVPRGFLSTLDVPDAPRVDAKSSGRRELAQWLTNPKNPLTARVMANRVWHHLFGQGLVSTVDNFGVMGDKPANPELLDHIAQRFIREGWSVKKLVRAIVLTRAYQLGADAPETHLRLDPANRLVWRHAGRRLDAEEMRDATLAAAGRLDLQRPEGSAAQAFRMVEIRDNGPETAGLRDHVDKSTQRSVYLPLLRGITPRTLEAFDPVDQTLVTGARDATTVPGQALFLLNSTFIRKQAQALADLLLKDKDATDAARVRLAYRLSFGRAPSEKEVDRAVGFLDEYAAAYDKQVADAPKLPAEENPVTGADARVAAWTSLAQALFGAAEFRYLR